MNCAEHDSDVIIVNALRDRVVGDPSPVPGARYRRHNGSSLRISMHSTLVDAYLPDASGDYQMRDDG